MTYFPGTLQLLFTIAMDSDTGDQMLPDRAEHKSVGEVS